MSLGQRFKEPLRDVLSAKYDEFEEDINGFKQEVEELFGETGGAAGSGILDEASEEPGSGNGDPDNAGDVWRDFNVDEIDAIVDGVNQEIEAITAPSPDSYIYFHDGVAEGGHPLD